MTLAMSGGAYNEFAVARLKGLVVDILGYYQDWANYKKWSASKKN